MRAKYNPNSIGLPSTVAIVGMKIIADLVDGSIIAAALLDAEGLL